MKVLAVIPARYASTRFPGKPLVNINGLPMIQRVYDQVEKCKLISKVIVATDDERIVSCVKSFGGNVQLTSPSHQSGTDRCGEIANQLEEKFNIIINVQGDEPYIQPQQLEEVLFPFQDPEVQISTLCKKINLLEEVENPNVVKVVKSLQHKALYFSRSPIPFVRNATKEFWLENANYYKHIGLYAFTVETLQKLIKLPIGTLEKVESLEQLRWLEAGFNIHVNESQYDSFGIDSPDDLVKVKSISSLQH